MSGRSGSGSALLRIPVSISESYVKPGEEQALFPNSPNFLTYHEVMESWPNGCITQDHFSFRGLSWRLLSRRPSGPLSPLKYLAVLDGEDQPAPAPLNSSGVSPRQRCPTGPQSRPLPDLDIDCTSGSANPMVPSSGISGSPSTTASWLLSQQHHLPGQQRQVVTQAAAQPGDQNRFLENLMNAESSASAMERYKAYICLMSAIKRRVAAARISQPGNPQSWASQEQQDLLKQIIMVGESLARFGTAEFSERSNASRAINTKDYATLLTQYLEAHGALFTMEFIAHLPPNVQDDVLTVRSLLQTRCQANSIIFNQLVKHVGTEGQGNGQAVVYNTSVVTANPTSIATASPKTLMQVAANAWAKATEKRSNRFGMMGAAAILGLWILKGRLLGGGRRGGRRNGDLGDTDYEHQGRGRRGESGAGGVLGLAERMLETRTVSERTAVAHMMACNEELQRAQSNIELLSNDWRMGQLRLAGGAQPPGYQPVDTTRCSLSGYLQSLEQPQWQAPVPQYAPRPYQMPPGYQLPQQLSAPPLVSMPPAAPGGSVSREVHQQEQGVAPAAAVTAAAVHGASSKRRDRRSAKTSDSSPPAGGLSQEVESDAVPLPWNVVDAISSIPTTLGQMLKS